jgi:hypothetical protein
MVSAEATLASAVDPTSAAANAIQVFRSNMSFFPVQAGLCRSLEKSFSLRVF